MIIYFLKEVVVCKLDIGSSMGSSIMAKGNLFISTLFQVSCQSNPKFEISVQMIFKCLNIVSVQIEGSQNRTVSFNASNWSIFDRFWSKSFFTTFAKSDFSKLKVCLLMF